MCYFKNPVQMTATEESQGNKSTEETTKIGITYIINLVGLYIKH